MFASGLRNPDGMAWEPESGVLWTAVNERDEMGSDLVPDYLTSVRDGGFYGWPYSSRVSRRRFASSRSGRTWWRTARMPDYGLGPHTASLGLAVARGGAAGAVARHVRRTAWIVERKPRSRLQGRLGPLR